MTKSRFQSPNLTPLGLNIWPLKGFTQEGEITCVGATSPWPTLEIIILLLLTSKMNINTHIYLEIYNMLNFVNWKFHLMNENNIFTILKCLVFSKNLSTFFCEPYLYLWMFIIFKFPFSLKKF
jgi:hypothetical protein